MDLTYCAPGEVGMNADALREMLGELERRTETHSILVIKDGKAVLEGAWAPYTADTPQMMHSLSKLGTAVCVGFAVSAGKLRLEDTFLDYVREDLPARYDPVLEKITIGDLLTMRAGSKEFFNNVRFHSLPSDWQTRWLEAERIGEGIGRVFHYDSGCSYTLSRIVSKLMGKTCLELMQERVFDKLGLGRVNWLSSPEGYSAGGWGMYLNVRQIGLLGQLLEQQGRWNGQQLIPADWVRELGVSRVLKAPSLAGRPLSHYGYHFHTDGKVFAACGAFGQYLFCFREFPVAVAVTAGTTEDAALAAIVEEYMEKAVNTPGPGDAAALREEAAALALPFAPGSAAAWEGEAAVLGRWIALDENPRGLRRVRFDREGGERLRVKLTLADGTVRTAWAGYRAWLGNDLFPDYTCQHHSLSYAFDGATLSVSDGMIETSYREVYRFDFSGEGVRCGWKPNVTYRDGNQNYERIFEGRFEDR